MKLLFLRLKTWRAARILCLRALWNWPATRLTPSPPGKCSRMNGCPTELHSPSPQKKPPGFNSGRPVVLLPIAQQKCCARKLRLRRCRRLGRWCTLRRRSARSRCRGLGRVALVEEPNNILRDVHRIRRENNRRSLPGTIQNHGERVVAGVFAQHVNHPAADAVHNLALRFVEIVLSVLRSALKGALKLLALALQPRLFIVAQRGLSGAQSGLDIFHLLLHVR